MTTKIAIVGIGKIAIDQHIPSINASAEWDLAATVSRNASVDGVENYTDLNQMLRNRPDISVVSLCIPPVPRFEYAKDVIAAGRHLMLEKPPGATLSEVHILRDLARDAGVSMFTTWHSREAEKVSAAKDWLADKDLKRVTITWKEDVRRWHPGQEWIWQAGGLGVFDPGINALSILTEILHQPIHLGAAELLFPLNKATPIAASLSFIHPKGADISAVFDWREEGDQIWEIDVETDKGGLKLSDGGATLEIEGTRHLANESAPLGGEYQRLYARMSELVTCGGSDIDLRPMTLVLDAFTLGNRHMVEPFLD